MPQATLSLATQNTAALTFAQCASIIEHKLRTLCRTTHEIEVVQRRCEKGFFIRSKGRPSMAEPVGLAYQLRKMAAWRGVNIQVGIFLEAFTDEVGRGMEHEEVVDFMVGETEISRLKWLMEGADLYVAPRGTNRAVFTPEMISEMEALASRLERDDRAVFAVYIEVQVPYN